MARQAELEKCRDLLDRGHVVLAGPAGVGKTRLARELAQWAAGAGWHVEAVVGTRAAAAIPLAAVVPLLPEVDDASSEALIRGTLQHLRRRAADRRLLVTVDDAHLLDEASATLVHLLAASRVASLVVTVTSGHATPEPIMLLWKDQLGVRVEIQPLSRRETSEVIRTVFASPLEDAVETQLWDLSLGNALFLRELVVSNVDAGALAQLDGKVRWIKPPVLAPRLGDLIESRMAGLSESDRVALETVALGEPLELDVLRLLCGDERCESLERRQLIAVARNQDRRIVRLAHPIYAHALRASMPESAVERIYLQLAEGLCSLSPRRSDDVLREVSWRLAARAPVAMALLEAAVVRAWERGQMALCERFALLATGGGDANGANAGLLTYALLAQSQMRQGRAQDALEPLQRRMAESTDGAQRELLICLIGLALSWGCGAIAQARAVVYDGITNAAEQPLRHAVAAVVELLDGRPDLALETGRRIVEQSADPVALSYGVSAMATTAFGSGDLALTQSILDEHASSAPNLLLPFAFVRKVSPHVVALAAHGRVGEAIEFCTPHLAQSVDEGDDTGLMRWAYSMGVARLLAGDLGHAASLLSDAAERSLRCEPAMSDLAVPFAWLAARLSGQQLPVPPAQATWPSSQCLRTLVHAVAKAGPEADFVAAVEQATSAGAPLYALVAAQFAARAGLGASVAGRAASAAEVLGGALAPLIVSYVEAAARDDAGSLEHTAASLAGLGYRWFAADAYAAASAAYRRGERNVSSTLTRRKARELAAAIGLAGVADDDDAGAILSDREFEVARLVADGLTNKEIAVQLDLSVRTVDAHVRSILQKLGISSRSEVGGLLR